MSEIRAVLVVPPGLHPHIYPWGVHLLADSLASIDVAATVVNLSRAPALVALADRYAGLLEDAYEALRPRAATLFFGHTLDRALLLGVLARAGEHFVDIARDHRLFRPLAIGNRGELGSRLRSLHPRSAPQRNRRIT